MKSGTAGAIPIDLRRTAMRRNPALLGESKDCSIVAQPRAFFQPITDFAKRTASRHGGTRNASEALDIGLTRDSPHRHIRVVRPCSWCEMQGVSNTSLRKSLRATKSVARWRSMSFGRHGVCRSTPNSTANTSNGEPMLETLVLNDRNEGTLTYRFWWHVKWLSWSCRCIETCVRTVESSTFAGTRHSV
jgi:hypothetical protein